MTLSINILYKVHILPREYKKTIMDIPVWVAIAATAVGSIITAFMYRHLTEAKVKSIVAETYDQLIKSLSSQVVLLQSQMAQLNKRLDHLSEKELHYLETITALTKERNALQIVISDKESKIHELEKRILENQNK